MDLQQIIPLSISLLFLTFVLIGFLVGVIRGLKKTVIRTIWIVLIGVLLIFITTPMALLLIRSNISWIPGVGGLLQGCSTIEEFIVFLASKLSEEINQQDLEHLVTLLMSISVAFISGILFLIFFVVFKYLSLPFYWILNIFIGKTKGKKHRLWGGAVGVVLGVIVFTFVSTPFAGYLNLIKKVDDISAGLTQTPYVASADDNTGKGVISSSPIAEIIYSVDDSVVIKVYDAIKLKDLQLVMFNQTSAVKLNNQTIKLNNEIESIGNIIICVMPFSDGTIDLSKFDEIINDSEQLENLTSNLSNVIDALYESSIFKATLEAAMPMLSDVMESSVNETLFTDSDLDPALAEPLKEVFSDLFDGMANSNPENIRNIFDSIIDTLEVAPKFMNEESIKSVTPDDFGKLGNVLDSFIENGFVKQESISKLVPAILDSTIIIVEGDTGVPESITNFIEDFKQAFTNEDISYTNELKAIGEIFAVYTNFDFENTSSITGEQFKDIGVALDKAFSYNSKILTRELVDDIVIGLLDMIDTGEGSEYDSFNEVFDLVKKPFENHEITSYEKEFDAFGEIIDYVTNLGPLEEIDLTEVGQKLDTVLTKDSKIINREVLNSIITLLIDEFKGELNEDLQPTLDKIKENITTKDLSYEKEFGCVQTLLDTFKTIDGEDIDIVAIGKSLDDVIAKSDIIDNDLVNDTILVLLDEFADEVEETFRPTIETIKDNITGELSYEKEFTAIIKLLDALKTVDIDNIDLKSIGKTLDEVVLESDIIDHNLINNAITTLIDDATEGVNEEYQDTINDIKTKFTGELVYETEFLALDSLLNVFDYVNKEEVDLAQLGKQLDDTIALGSKIITHELINDAIQVLIDEATEGVNEKYQDTITDIKTKFTGELVYETEFLAIDSLLNVFDYANSSDVDLANVGKQLDDTIALGSKIITRDLINSSIKILIDESTDGVNENYQDVIADIKDGFNDDTLVYKAEFEAVSILLDAINEASGEGNLTSIGKDLDYIVNDIESKIITRNVIKSVIEFLIDDSTANVEDQHVLDTISTIKDGFTHNDLSYELEFKAIDKLIDIFDRATEGQVNLSQFGEDLDDILKLNGRIITKTLINDFIYSSFDSFVTDSDIAQAGSLSTSLSNVKGRLIDTNYPISSYKTEFVAIDKLIEVSSIAGSITVDTIESKLFDNNTKTVGEVFDDKIKNSVLLGDCGLAVIDSILDEFIKNNNGENGNRDYSKITKEISDNYQVIKPKVKCGSNKNLNATTFITYEELALAFDEIHHYLDDQTHKVTDKTEFTIDTANYYESSLYELEDNLLLGYNGARAVASYICDEIAVILEEKAQEVIYPDVAEIIRSYKTIILNYKAYLERPETLTNNKLNEKEPYSSTGATEYVTSTDGFKTNITFTTTKPTGYFAYRTNPFTSIATEIASYL